MGFLDKLLGRDKARSESESGGGREGARVTAHFRRRDEARRARGREAAGLGAGSRPELEPRGRRKPPSSFAVRRPD
jgi:hypothetical protein